MLLEKEERALGVLVAKEWHLAGFVVDAGEFEGLLYLGKQFLNLTALARQTRFTQLKRVLDG